MTVSDEVVGYVVRKVEQHFRDDVDAVITFGNRELSFPMWEDPHPRPYEAGIYLVVNNQRGQQAVENFIYRGQSYDVFAVSWKRLKSIAALKESNTHLLGTSSVKWVSRPEVGGKLIELQAALKRNLEAHKRVRAAEVESVLTAEDLVPLFWEKNSISAAREGLAFVAENIAEAYALHNATFFKEGCDGWYQELQELPLIAGEFLTQVDQMLNAVTLDEVLELARYMAYQAQVALRVHGVARLVTESHVTDIFWPSNTTMAFLSEEEREKAFWYATEENRKVDPDLDIRKIAWWYEENYSRFRQLQVAVENSNQMGAYLHAAHLQYGLRNEVAAPWKTTDLLGAWDRENLGALQTQATVVEQSIQQLIAELGLELRAVDTVDELEQADPVRNWEG